MSRLKSKVLLACDSNAKLSIAVVATPHSRALSQTAFSQSGNGLPSTRSVNIKNGGFNGRTDSTDCLGKEYGSKFPGGKLSILFWHSTVFQSRSETVQTHFPKW
jgi:hypothetical protein